MSALFGANYVIMRWVLAEVPPRAWVLYRVGFAAVLLVPLALLLARRRAWPERRSWPGLVLATLLGVCLNQVMFAEGLARTTPGQAALINAAIPVLTFCFAVAARQERFERHRILAIAVALSGVLVLLQPSKGSSSAATPHPWLGNLFVLGNVMAFSAFLVLVRRLHTGADPLLVTAFMLVAGSIMLTPWSAPSLDGASWQGLARVWPWAAYGIVGCTVLTYFLNNWALRHAHSSQVALYIYLQPVIATALGAARGEEHPDARFWLAAALVCGGLALHGASARARSTESAAVEGE